MDERHAPARYVAGKRKLETVFFFVSRDQILCWDERHQHDAQCRYINAVSVRIRLYRSKKVGRQDKLLPPSPRINR